MRYGIEHPVINDSDFAVWKSFGVRAWPTFILISPDGRIVQVYSGEGNRGAAEEDIEKLLEKYKGKINESPLPIALEKNKQPNTVLKFPGKITILDGYFSGRPDPIAISDSGHNRILIASSDSGEVMERIGSGEEGLRDGDFSGAQFRRPQGVLYQQNPGGLGAGGILYIADTENHALRKIDLKAKTVTTVAGTGTQGDARPLKDAPAKTTALASPWDLAFYPDNDHIAIAMAGTHQLWSYDINKQTLTTIAGNGNESIDDGAYPNNSLSQPSGLSAYGGKLYFVDSETSSLRVYDGREIHTLIGTGLFDFGYKEGKQGAALMQHPLGV